MEADNYSSELTDSVSISLSEDELIETYNYVPKVLSRKAIKVSIVEVGGGGYSNSGVLLGEERNGNYWVVATENGDRWLLPKANFRINSFNENTVKSLFECNGSPPEDAREFMLVKLARVSLTPGGDRWRLEERGVLDFGENSRLSQLQSELKGVKEQREKLESELGLARGERDRLAFQVAELAYERLQETLARLEEGDRWRNDFTARLERLEQAEVLPEQRYSNLETELSQRLARLKSDLSQKLALLQSQLSKLEESEINNIKHRLRKLESEINSINNKILQPTQNGGGNIQKSSVHITTPISNDGTPVGVTMQSIEQLRLGGNKPIICEKYRRGNYLIVKEGVVEYMVPKNNIKINEFNRETVALLFEFQGYRLGYSGFKLIKPARVSAISEGETWQLVERGVLQFY